MKIYFKITYYCDSMRNNRGKFYLCLKKLQHHGIGYPSSFLQENQAATF